MKSIHKLKAIFGANREVERTCNRKIEKSLVIALSNKNLTRSIETLA